MSNTTTASITVLNITHNPYEFEGVKLGEDGHGNELWAFGDKVANRYTDAEGISVWTGDVEGWNYTADDVIEA